MSIQPLNNSSKSSSNNYSSNNNYSINNYNNNYKCKCYKKIMLLNCKLNKLNKQ